MDFISVDEAKSRTLMSCVRNFPVALLWSATVMLGILSAEYIQELFELAEVFLTGSEEKNDGLAEFLQRKVELASISFLSLLLLIELVSCFDHIPKSLRRFLVAFSLVGIFMSGAALKAPELVIPNIFVIFFIVPLTLYRVIILISVDRR
ncbi:MAG: hypothetical protein MRK00_01930 [Nitrosomonas sp.]|nr:hypothetical protein [Nitrosomonas sp.]